jgi:hypothetical protein
VTDQDALTELARVLHDHRPEPNLPPLLVSGCQCGWGSEVYSHTAHLAQEVDRVVAARVAQVTADKVLPS